MFPRYATYRGEQYKLMTLTEAMAELNKQVGQGKKPAIVSLRNGFIVTKAVFSKEEFERW